MFFIKFILFIFIAALILLLFIAFSFYNTIRKASHRFQERQPQNQTKVNGNVIIDQRSPEETSKKIISDDEGEYVDFEE